MAYNDFLKRVLFTRLSALDETEANNNGSGQRLKIYT